MTTEKPRRKIHEKEKFLEGNRQRWLVIFLIFAVVIFGFDAAGKITKVDSYLTFLTFLSGSFILGYSGTETMKLFRVTSQTDNVNQVSTETVKEESKREITEHIIQENLSNNAKEPGYKI
jgi:hypothetical protein